jgi:hypothetical protein
VPNGFRAALALTVGLGISTAQAQTSRPADLSAGRVAAQVGLGTLLTPVGFFGSGWAAEHLGERLGWSETRVTAVSYVAAYSGAWLAAASGPALAGKDGRMTAALGGSLVGLGGAVLTVKLGNWLYDEDRRPCGVLCWTLGALTVALPSIGATLAYNASRP